MSTVSKGTDWEYRTIDLFVAAGFRWLRSHRSGQVQEERTPVRAAAHMPGDLVLFREDRGFQAEVGSRSGKRVAIELAELNECRLLGTEPLLVLWFKRAGRLLPWFYTLEARYETLDDLLERRNARGHGAR